MSRRASWLGALLCAGCLGQPEDLFKISGSFSSTEVLSTEAVVTLWRDEGRTETGCSSFSKWKTIDRNAGDSFSVPLLRAEAETATQQPRCFRLEILDGDTFIEATWIFSDQDVTLPTLSWQPPWVDLSGGQVRLFPLTVSDFRPLEKPLYIAELLSSTMRWRQVAPGISVDFPDLAWEGIGVGTVKGYAKFTGSTAVYDPFGQLKQHRYEIRMGRTLSLPASQTFSPTPGSRGRECDLPMLPCPLTDGLALPRVLPAQTTAVTLSFPLGTRISQIALRGLWAGDELESIRIESSPDTVGEFTIFAGARVTDLLRAHRKLDEAAPSIDVGPFVTPPDVPVMRLRIRGVDAQGRTLPLLTLGEVSAYP